MQDRTDMGSVSYNNEKNEITMKHLGNILIPEDQIIEIEITKKMVLDMKEYVNSPINLLDADNCLYCGKYWNGFSNTCNNCPMELANNRCGTDANNTYDICDVATEQLSLEKKDELRIDLVSLGKRFIEAHEHLLDNDS